MRKVYKTNQLLFGLCLLAAISSRAQAGVIVGGSTLLGLGDVAQLEAWLGEGPLTLTNIFTHVPGDGLTSTDFHAAADGQGRTFSVVQVVTPVSRVVGGYNPQSWHSSGVYNLTPDDVDRTAFVFNLTTATLLPQITGDGPGGTGRWQTYNYTAYGPTFGGGHDLVLYPNLDTGYGNTFSYGGPPGGGPNVLGLTGFASATYGTLEVFTIASAPAVPEPSSFVLTAIAFTACGVVARRRPQRRGQASFETRANRPRGHTEV